MLVQELTALTDAELSLLVASIAGASGNVRPNAPMPQRVADLIDWAESRNGPGQEVVIQTFQRLFPQRHTPERVWNVPYERNPFFTGRVDVLKQLHSVL